MKQEHWSRLGYAAEKNICPEQTDNRLANLIYGFMHTPADVQRKSCRHVVDIENDYFDKEVVNKMVIDHKR